MAVTVLYFAALRDVVGSAEESIDLPEGVRTIGELVAHLARRYPSFAERRAHVRIARNEAFASDGDPVADGDVVALIPPVAGG
jgi:molybdopterin converting factor subunit 1